jgi:hypothetical protein
MWLLRRAIERYVERRTGLGGFDDRYGNTVDPSEEGGHPARNGWIRAGGIAQRGIARHRGMLGSGGARDAGAFLTRAENGGKRRIFGSKPGRRHHDYASRMQQSPQGRRLGKDQPRMR